MSEKGEVTMRDVIVSEFLTLDGVMQAPGMPDEDRSGGFEHGGWQISLMDEEAGAAVIKGLEATGALLLGRVTYEIFAGYWPTAPDDDPIAQTINGLPKYVASTTLQEPLPWAKSHVITDVARDVARLKEEDGGVIRVIGSGQLVQALMEHDLVDRFELMIYGIVLGTGKRLFKEGSPRRSLRLVEGRASKTGVLMATYEPER